MVGQGKGADEFFRPTWEMPQFISSFPTVSKCVSPSNIVLYYVGDCKKQTCRSQTPDIPRAGWGEAGARRGGGAERGWAR